MKKLLTTFVVAASLASALPVSAADDDVALVKAVTGHVSIVQGGATRDAASGSHLRIADHVVTAPGATAAIVFKDGTLLTVGGGADVDVRDYAFQPKAGKYAFSLYMTKGSAIYESGKIGKLSPESVKVATPKATVGVRGTRFLIEAG